MTKLNNKFLINCASVSKLFTSGNGNIYTLVINVNNLPSNLPTKVNPRHVNTHKTVFKNMCYTLSHDPKDFEKFNKGMTITAKSININGQKVLLDLSNVNKCGLVDGGHTYKAILLKRKTVPKNENAYVIVRIMTGVKNTTKVSKALNTGSQVSYKALVHEDGKFKPIHDVLSGSPCSKDISYTQYDGKSRDIQDILALQYAATYHSKRHGGQPSNAYSAHITILKNYAKNLYKDKGSIKHIPEFLKLYDYIEMNFKKYYRLGGGTKQLNKLQGFNDLGNEKVPTKYLYYKTNCIESAGLLMPIFAGLRCIFIRKVNGEYFWKVNPFKLIDKSLPPLSANIVDADNKKHDWPYVVGKHRTAYRTAYQIMSLISKSL